MRTEIRDAWVTALLSGDYEQGTGSLHQKTIEGKDQWCCLGVLCDLAIKAGVDIATGIETAATPHGGIETWFGEKGNVCYPPDSVWNWAEPGEGSGFTTGPGEDLQHSLATMNDGGCSFTEIAAKIGAQL